MSLKKTLVTKPKKNMQQKQVVTTITDLVRDNVSALLRDRIAADVIHNETRHRYSKWMLRLEERLPLSIQRKLTVNADPVDQRRWTPERLAKEVGAQTGDIRRIFESKSGKGAAKLWIDEIIPVAIKLGVSPGFLLQPLREDLENNSILVFPSFGAAQMQVPAQEWFKWVHGFQALPSQGGEEFEKYMTIMSGKRNLPVGNVNQMEYDLEQTRIAESAYLSPVSAHLASNERPIDDSMFQDHEVPTPHPFDYIEAEKTVVGRMQKRIQLVFIYMTHVRMALRLVQDPNRKERVRSDIEWGIRKIREDLTKLAANQEFHQKTVSAKSD